MNHFTIKDIENLSGIKAHTLRIWEKRYGIIIPKRKQSRHRFYDNEDLKQVLRITHLYKNGYKISAIANMRKDEWHEYETKSATSNDSLIKILLEATIDIDEALFSETLDKTISASGLEASMIKVIYPYFEKIGMLWMNNDTLPAQERFASNIILKKIVSETDKLGSFVKQSEPAIVLFTPPREHHEIPLLFMQYLLRKNQYHVYYLGTNTGFDVLDAFIKKNKTGILYFHVIVNLNHDKIDNYLQQITERYSDQRVVMSGKLTQSVSFKAKKLQLLHSLDEMIAFGNSAF